MDLSDADDEVGGAVRAYRRDAGMRQDELAAAAREHGVNLTPATIGKIERGERRVTFGEAMALASALQVDPASLAHDPSRVQVDVILHRLRAERADLKEALLRFESCQFQAANEADYHGVATDELRVAVLESLEVVVEEHRADMTASNSLERQKAARLGLFSPWAESGLAGEREDKFGVTTFSSPVADQTPGPSSPDWTVRARLAQRGEADG